MRIVRRPAEIRSVVRRARRAGLTIGFVPTLGALHEGHLSLIRAARRENDRVAVSIFVNPLQFDRKEDLRSYPRTLASDAQLSARAGADWLFVPSARHLYPTGFQTFVEVTELGRRWEGRFRPGHFRGVATVVAKLFHLVQPDSAYFGQKDAQQARLVGQMIRDLDFGIRLRVLPTVREPDGLAMSSRNRRLSTEARRSSRVLFEALQEGGRLIQCACRRPREILRRMRGRIRRAPEARIDYVAIVDPERLEPVAEIRGPVLMILAVWIGKTRLMDCGMARPPIGVGGRPGRK